MDPSERRDYDTACEIAPEIVRDECPVSLFLRTENDDPVRAAQRLARYWNARRWAFGERRYLFPLNQTGSGALDADDIALLRSGYHVHLTYDAPAEQGGPGLVALHNEGRLTRPAGYAHVRIVFYLIQLYKDYVNNATVLHVVADTPRPPIELDTRPWETYRTALPVRITQNIVAQVYNPTKKELLDYYGYRCATVERFNSYIPPNRIVADSVQGTFQMLRARGLFAKCLPRCLGGSYDYAQHNEWVRTRISIEDIMSGAPLSSRCYRPSTVDQVTQIASVGRRGVLVRMANERARRKYTKRKLLQQSIDHGGNSATITTGKMKDTNDDDENADNEDDDVPAELVNKERNNLYSRRSYQKRKLEIFSLENQCHVLRSQNEMIRQDNALLEGLLQRARVIIATILPTLPPPGTLPASNGPTADDLGVTDEEIVGLLRRAQPVAASTVRHLPPSLPNGEGSPTTTDPPLHAADPEIFPVFLDPASILNPWDETDIGDDHSLCP